jgi:ATP-dependent Clp protease protease subunit
MIRAHIPGRPGDPGGPRDPFQPERQPFTPFTPPAPSVPAPSVPAPVSPTRVWADPHAGWQATLYEGLLAKRIVLASGVLDDAAASRLSAQLLTLDAEGDRPIRLELQNLRAELAAVLTILGILDVLRAPVHGCVSGELSGPALALLAGCEKRTGYPNAVLTLAEPRVHFAGTATAVTAREQHVLRMLDTVYFKLAEMTGRPVEEIREDARQGRVLTTGQAVGYGLIQAQEGPR